MEEFLISCCDAYLAVAQIKSLCAVTTPFVEEDDRDNPARIPYSTGEGLKCPWCKIIRPLGDFEELAPGVAGQRPARNIKSKASDSSTPCAAVMPSDDIVKGKLANVAAKILMKVFYAARLARFDLLRAIGHLACHITKWAEDCDRRLHHLMCYVNSTLKHRLTGWVGYCLGDLSLHLYGDADFAGDAASNKSTSGVFLGIEGPPSSFSYRGDLQETELRVLQHPRSGAGCWVACSSYRRPSCLDPMGNY
jgi:hypothetical protein